MQRFAIAAVSVLVTALVMACVVWLASLVLPFLFEGMSSSQQRLLYIGSSALSSIAAMFVVLRRRGQDGDDAA